MICEPNVKINLGLNVLRKRGDGFHDLETLFVPYFGISDTLEIISGEDFSQTSASLFARYGTIGEEGGTLAQSISEDGKLMMTIARKEGVSWNPAKDLCARAYHLLDGRYHLPPAKIFLEKKSPVGAGLGGGSSDAAFALKMLSDIFALDLSDGDLAGYAAELGSDCAFFVYNRPMLGEGRGEQLSAFPLTDIDYGQDGGGTCKYELKVIVPENLEVSTAEAYRGISPAVPESRLQDILGRPVSEWKACLSNDFEKTVFANHPELAAIKASLYDSGAVYAAMSGSGSAMFALYEK